MRARGWWIVASALFSSASASAETPEGTHVESRANPWLIAGGATLFAASYGVSVYAGLTERCYDCGRQPSRQLLIPVAGPFSYAFDHDEALKGSERIAPIAVGTLQIVGLGLFVWGLVPRNVLVDDPPPYRPMKTIGFVQLPGGFGLFASGGFD